MKKVKVKTFLRNASRLKIPVIGYAVPLEGHGYTKGTYKLLSGATTMEDIIVKGKEV